MSKPPPPAPTASAIGPCPTIIKIVGRLGTGSLPSTIAPPPMVLGKLPVPGRPINLDESRAMAYCAWGWSGGVMVLGKLLVPGRPTVWITVGQGLTALAVSAGGGCYEFFNSHLSFLSSFSLSLGDGPI